MKPQTNRPKPLCGVQSSLETIQPEQNFVLFMILIHYCLRQFIMCVAQAIVGFFSFQFVKGAEKCKALVAIVWVLDLVSFLSLPVDGLRCRKMWRAA